jgi:hypothetical protein
MAVKLDQLSNALSQYETMRRLENDKHTKEQQETEHKARISHQARTLAEHNDGYLRGGQTTKEIHRKRREEKTFRDIAKRLGGLKHDKFKNN